jgi:hypothetical protein
MPDETTPQLPRSEYESKIETLAERMLRQLAEDETGELTYEESEIRPLLSETETVHREYPFSTIKHGRYDPNPGAWSWINDAGPREGLYRQALDMLAQDVARLVERYAKSKTFTYRQDETTYVRESFNSEIETSAEKESNDPTDEGERTRLTVRTVISDPPAAGTDEYEQMMRAAEDAVEGALYERGFVGHETSASTKESK